MNIPLLVVSSLFFLAGFWGLFIPVIPDLPLVWLGVLIYAVATKFADISVTTVIILGILAAGTYLIDYLTTSLGAKRFGATKKGMAGAIIGGVIGIFLFPPLGFVVGAILGTLFAELYLSGRSAAEAARASKGALIGLVVGLVTKVAFAGIIIGVFLSSVL